MRRPRPVARLTADTKEAFLGQQRRDGKGHGVTAEALPGLVLLVDDAAKLLGPLL